MSEVFAPVERAAEGRQARLRRHLLTADVVSACLVGVLATPIAGLAPHKVPLMVLTMAACWPLLAYVRGLYAVDDLRSWASGLAEAPRLAVCALLISWPLYGLLTALDARDPVTGALFAALTTRRLAAGSAGRSRGPACTAQASCDSAS